MFNNLKNYDSHLIFQKIVKFDFKINVTLKTIEKYMNFTIQQPKKKGIKLRLPLAFIDSVYFSNNSLHNLVKNLGNNNFYHLNQEFNTKALDLLQKKGFFPMIFGIVLKSSMNDYPTKINFIIY